MKNPERKHKPIFINLLILVALISITLIPVLSAVTADTSNVVYYAQCDENSASFAEALDSLGIDSTRSNRAAIAAVNRIDNYSGTDAQDQMLLSLLKSGKLVQSMPDPVTPAIECYKTYTTVASIPTMNGCGAMEGIAVGSKYLYTVKVNSDNTCAFVSMTNRSTGETTTLTNVATGTYYFDDLAHANDMDVCGIDGYSNLFITTALKGDGAVVRLQRVGSTLTKVGSYTLTYNGSEINAAGLAVTKVSNGTVYLLTKLGKTIYSGSISTSATSGTIELTKEFKFDVSQVYIDGTLMDLTSWVNQGFEYYKDKIYVPLSGDSDNLDSSVILVYDITNASGTIYADPHLSFSITSRTYASKFEIESCGICTGDGQLYFSTNRCKSDTDTNHDAVHYITGYVCADWS